MSYTVSDGRIRTSAPITPIRRLPGGSPPLGVINTAVTRGRMEFHSRGGGGTSPQGPIPQKKKSKKKKSRRKKLTGSRSQVPPHRAALELCTKLGSQTSDQWRGVHVGAGPECRWECVEDIQSSFAIVHCVGFSCGVDSSTSRCIHTHKKTHAWSESLFGYFSHR